METQAPTQSRAVLRQIEPGNNSVCPGCDLQVKFAAKRKASKVICNVYIDGKWDRVEQWHHECYDASDEPHGAIA